MTLISGPANAHASEQGLVLLLPTDVYIVAGTLTVIASIVLVICLPPNILSKLFAGFSFGQFKSVRLGKLCNVTSFATTVFLACLIYIGFQGPNDPQNNLLPLSIWTLWWVGMFVVQGLVFDIWKWVNPWGGITRILGLGENPIFRLPNKLAAWPAVLVLVLFQLFLLADVAPSDPQRLAGIVLGYWVFILIGIELFGRDVWINRVECFSVMFRLIGALRPLQYHDQLHIGFPGWTILKHSHKDLSLAAFCLVILTGGSFDGVNETFWWLAQIGINPLEFPGRSAVVVSSTLGLFCATLLLFVVFGASVGLGVKIVNLRGTSGTIPYLDAFQMFAVTLLPIALGYHFAHYLVTFLIQFKVTLSAASDPLALGWNLFGLGAVKVMFGFLSVPETVKTIWITQAFVVVFSHIASVVMGHYVAHKICGNNKDVILLQIGLSVLMIAYTVFGLWLLASPRGA